MVKHIREFMETRRFVDIATPILTVSSPEGARFSRAVATAPGKVFMPAAGAPQQYKQLLMVAGFDRYYQIAPCLRDEDPRADRSPGEFYQLDVETSFLEPDEFFKEMEPLFTELTEKVAGKKSCKNRSRGFHTAKFSKPRLQIKPDLRYGLPMRDVTEWGTGPALRFFRSEVCPGARCAGRSNVHEKRH